MRQDRTATTWPAAGAPAFAAWTLVFGSTAAGAKLLAKNIAAAIDIPLRLAVVAAESGRSEIVLRDMRSLLDDALGELADAFPRDRSASRSALTVASGAARTDSRS